MNLTGEHSTESQLLTARYVSEDTKIPAGSTVINSTLLCHTYSLQPDFHSYFEALQGHLWTLCFCGFLVLLTTCVVFWLTLRSARRQQKWRDCRTSVTVVLAVYPLVSAGGFIAIILPRSRLIAEAIAQEAVVIALYHLYFVILADCNGVDDLFSRAKGSRLETRVLPCCCWPCCLIPRPEIKKKTLKWLRLLVLQVPVTQTIIYVIMLLLWTEDIMLYLESFAYIQPIVAVSILTGVWSIIMCVRLVESHGATPRARFLVFQLVLLIVKLQCGFAKFLPEIVDLPCILPLNPSVIVNMIHNSVMMIEMLILSICAWRLYYVS